MEKSETDSSKGLGVCMLFHRVISRPLLRQSYYPWFVWGVAASAFLIDYFARVAPGVMVDLLMRDFQVQALGLGSLSACFYYTYIAMQVPVGLLVDRFSPMRLSAAMLLVCAAGCLLFANATRVEWAAVARLITGFGAAFAFVSALKLASIWFPSEKLGLLAGLTQALGMLGAAAGQAPMALLVAYVGWRTSLSLMAGFMALLALLMVMLVRDRPSRSHRPLAAQSTTIHEWLTDLLTVLRKPQSWWNALFAGLLYAPTAALAELWGVKFLRQAYGLSNETAAFAIGLIFIGWALGGPLAGWLSDRWRRRKAILLLSASLSLILASVVLFIPGLSVTLLLILLFAYGLSNTGVAITYAVAAEIHPHALLGTSLAFTNMVSILVGAGFQPLIGWLLDHHWNGVLEGGVPVYSTQDFHWAMATLPLCLLLAIVLALRIKETYCQSQA